MDKIIPLRINETLVNELDDLVEQGYFTSRNEGLRSSLRSLVHHYRRRPLEGHQIVASLCANHLGALYPDLIKKIYLFGSVANNTHREDSDIDLFALTQKRLGYHEKLQMHRKLVSLIGSLPFIPSLHFEKEAMFEEALASGMEFETNIMKKGIILWENE